MKIFQIILVALFLFAGNEAIAQKVKTIKFEVDGVCDMCKDRIEGAVDVKGIKFASYDLDKHQMEVTFSTKKITEDKIHQLIADVGHDTDKIKATDEAYDQIHHCCKYRETRAQSLSMRLASFFLAVLISSAVLGQNVSGEVKGKTDEGIEPLIGATVYFPGSTSGVFTDENGEFSLELPEGVGTMVVSYVGFNPDTLAVQAGEFYSITLIEGEVLREAEIEAESESTEMSLIDPLNVQVITEQELSKAACCNLSESFETNAAVDASYTDAVTGTAQIRMLGLDGKYTQIMQDVVPSVRGLSVLTGLNYIPGPWIQSIQVSKGVGSVSNGYESMTGQINVTMKNPDNAEKLYVNAYGNQGGRTELNAAYLVPVGKRLNTLISAHGELNDTRQDMNKDGFMDNPLKRDVVFRNAWKYRSLNDGWRGEYQFTFVEANRLSGQLDYNSLSESLNGELWGTESKTQMIQAYAKTGYVFESCATKSFGSQISYTLYDQESNFGRRMYDGRQESARVNLLYGSKLGVPAHRILTGVSFQYDDFSETLDSLDFARVERVSWSLC